MLISRDFLVFLIQYQATELKKKSDGSICIFVYKFIKYTIFYTKFVGAYLHTQAEGTEIVS